MNGEERVQYAVMQLLGEWRVVRLGWRADRFAARQEALSAAQRLARDDQAAGREVEVLLEAPSGRPDEIAPATQP